MSAGRKLLKDASLIFFMGLLASGFGYLIRMVLSRQLTLEEYGLFWAVFTFVMFFSIFRDFGLSQSLAKFIPQFLVKKEYDKIKTSIVFVLFVNLVVSLFIAIVLFLLSNFLILNYFRSELARPILYILLGYFVFHNLYVVLIQTFMGFQKSKVYSVHLLLTNFFVLFGLIIFSSFGIISPAISYLLATGLGLCIFSIILFKHFNFSKYSYKFKGELGSNLFSHGLPILLASLGYVVIGQIDVLMLTYFRTLSEVGIYNVVLPTAMILVTLGSSMALALLPLVSKYWIQKKFNELRELVYEIHKKAFLIIVPVSLVVFVFSDLFLKILFGVEFIGGSLPLKILIIGAILFSLASINSSILAAIGKPNIITKIITFVMCLNIVLNLTLIPMYGMVGAALSTSISYLFVLLFTSFSIRKYLGSKIPIYDWLKIFFSGIVMISVMNFIKGILILNIFLETFFVLLIGGLVYLGLIKISVNFK
ncbi:flippase [archaeon]|jgi:O-antigen/teichoic acid export membrane protein|nr:flippase [archaeon]